jgi:hypothetical protein
MMAAGIAFPRVKWTVILVAVLASAAAASAAPAVAAPCTVAQARAAVAAAKPRIPGESGARVPVDPKSIDRVLCYDFTRDGRTDLALSVASGGTAGDVGWLVLQRTAGGWRLAIGQSGYKLGLFRVGDDVVISQPIYRKYDPNCCPTGGFAHDRYHWNGTRFALVRSYKTKRYTP